MAAFGEDFLGGRRRLFQAPNPAGLWIAVGVAVALVVVNQLLQSGFGWAAASLFSGPASDDPGRLIKGFLIGIFPASLLTAVAAWYFARIRGGVPSKVLNLHLPKLGWLGWAITVGGFMAGMYALLIAAVLVLGIDVAQYQPTEGQDNSDRIGLVKQAMFDIAHNPALFMLVLPSVVLGAPIAEEFIFRGQLFTALSQTWLGFAGTSAVTSAAWAVLHLTEPWFSVGIIFVMGLAFGYLMWRFGSLWVTIACHAVWNGIYSMIMFSSAGP
jgi:membrane protease YdiL (CAAX protease family)